MLCSRCRKNKRAVRADGKIYSECQPCRDRGKKYYQQNRYSKITKAKEHQRRNYEVNKDKIKERNKRYNETHKKERYEYNKQYKIDHPGYDTWLGIGRRCNDPNHRSYPSYGAKGIKNELKYNDKFVEWLFDENNCPLCSCELTDGKLCATKRTIDRKDSNKNYTFENCRIICLRCNIRLKKTQTKVN